MNNDYCVNIGGGKTTVMTTVCLVFLSTIFEKKILVDYSLLGFEILQASILSFSLHCRCTA